jgi:hypothetical protein
MNLSPGGSGFISESMEPKSGIEPLTSSLPRMCSNQLSYLGMPPSREHPGAGDGARTRNNQLGRLELYQLSYSRAKLVERGGFEPP